MTTEPMPAGLGEQWTYAQIAAHLNVQANAVRAYASSGRMPAPDGRLGGTPWWWEGTIRDWAAARPGKGARTDLQTRPL